jgi:hypothetical protein
MTHGLGVLSSINLLYTWYLRFGLLLDAGEFPWTHRKPHQFIALNYNLYVAQFSDFAFHQAGRSAPQKTKLTVAPSSSRW